jgi:hypothetical protein
VTRNLPTSAGAFALRNVYEPLTGPGASKSAHRERSHHKRYQGGSADAQGNAVRAFRLWLWFWPLGVIGDLDGLDQAGGFHAKTVNINQDDSVTWTNNDTDQPPDRREQRLVRLADPWPGQVVDAQVRERAARSATTTALHPTLKGTVVVKGARRRSRSSRRRPS